MNFLITVKDVFQTYLLYTLNNEISGEDYFFLGFFAVILTPFFEVEITTFLVAKMAISQGSFLSSWALCPIQESNLLSGGPIIAEAVNEKAQYLPKSDRLRLPYLSRSFRLLHARIERATHRLKNDCSAN